MNKEIFQELVLVPTSEGLMHRNYFISGKINLQDLELVIKTDTEEVNPSKGIQQFSIPVEAMTRIGNSEKIVMEAVLLETNAFYIKEVSLIKKGEKNNVVDHSIAHKNILAVYKTTDCYLIKKPSDISIQFNFLIDFNEFALSAPARAPAFSNDTCLVNAKQVMPIANTQKLIANLSSEDAADLIGTYYDGLGRVYILVLFTKSLTLYLITYFIQKNKFTFKGVGKLPEKSTRVQAGICLCNDDAIAWYLLTDTQQLKLTIPKYGSSELVSYQKGLYVNASLLMIDQLPCTIAGGNTNRYITYDTSYKFHDFLNYSRKYPLVFNLFGYIYVIGGRTVEDSNQGFSNLVEYHKICCYSVYGRGKISSGKHFNRMWSTNYENATSTQFYSNRDIDTNYKEWLPAGNAPTDSACVLGNDIYIFKPSTFSSGRHYFYTHNFIENSWNRLVLNYTSAFEIQDYDQHGEEDDDGDGYDDDFSSISKSFKVVTINNNVCLFFVNLGESNENKRQLSIEVQQLMKS